MLRRIAELPVMVILMGMVALSMFVPAAHAVASDAERIGRVFFYSGLLLLVLTAMVGIATRRRRAANLAHSHLVSLAAAYLILPLMLALPFSQAVRDTSFANAWFEMVSCFTTTGATLYQGEDRLIPTLHLWRAQVGWMGGFFFLVMAVAVLSPLNLGGIEVISGRTPGRGTDGVAQITRTADPQRRLSRHAAAVFPVYGGLTLVLWVILLMQGEVGIVALSHAMSTLSASGISPGGSFADMQTGFWAEAAVFVFLAMALTRRSYPGATVLDRSGPIWRDPEVRIAMAILAAVPVILFLRHWISAAGTEGPRDPVSALRALWGALFTTMSFLTTTGFESREWTVARDWSGLGAPGLVLAGLAIVGGGVATTAGGVRLLRVYALFRHSERELERIIHPHSVGGQGTAARRLRREGAFVAWVFFMLFASTIAVVTGALTLTGLDFQSALVLCLSALTLTGPLADVAAAAPVAWASLDGAAKTVLGLTMVVGRLEMLAVLALLAPDIWRSGASGQNAVKP